MLSGLAKLKELLEAVGFATRSHGNHQNLEWLLLSIIYRCVCSLLEGEPTELVRASCAETS